MEYWEDTKIAKVGFPEQALFYVIFYQPGIRMGEKVLKLEVTFLNYQLWKSKTVLRFTFQKIFERRGKTVKKLIKG